ncbi:putative glycolipid-binding domain-containing protein [Microbacterium sp. zg.Y1090]|uniref:putative glycolipid-binding domain-containing protein n=1 Tax=Microbacterium TaxID=33882 RepID=UPI00214AC963|nr:MULTISPECIES: putative glycolipid-binding domain-containing protein [unclassified Microbacterium]MCR2812701.1 putative glycolipid-binding domain-containing protein [Microbacterium sp. zg.Y1084]MCR2817504.1 putative glycolipid-binding domain-containing protein [Microbacterium sp. zg.Y1090]MDL5485853.1 putative glycolipid-binding domain-containing protein [Microbacterium sp. zg-Y1211]WIM29013.1 putative glycolipid-binding domain-containing protein [Microbacterium sp. zg-Y1090]
MDSERYQWRGEDDPSRVDTAYVRFRNSGLRAHGSSVTQQYTLSWTLDVGDGWVTNHLRVRSLGKGWSRSLDLRRGGDAAWRATVTQTGAIQRWADPGLDDDTDLSDALDCDLGLCPVTNVMPIRRLDLHRRDRDEEQLTAAWVDVPSLQVRRERQHYGSHDRTGKRTVTYANEDRSFSADLSVDHDGMVVDYPGLAWRFYADA